MMRADVVAHEMNHRDVRINLAVQLRQKSQAFLLTFAISTVPIDLARAGIKGRKEIERPGALVCVFAPVGKVLGLGRQGWVPTGMRRSGGLLLHREHHCILTERARVTRDELGNCGRECGVP